MATLDMKAKQLQKAFEQMVYQFQAVTAEIVATTDKLSPKEMNAIVFVGKKGECIMREISAFLGVADSTVTMLVDNLVNKKFVKRQYSETDRRIINILLTDAGKAIYADHQKAYRKLCSGMLMTLNENEQDLYVNLMAKIAEGSKEQFEKN